VHEKHNVEIRRQPKIVFNLLAELSVIVIAPKNQILIVDSQSCYDEQNEPYCLLCERVFPLDHLQQVMNEELSRDQRLNTVTCNNVAKLLMVVLVDRHVVLEAFLIYFLQFSAPFQVECLPRLIPSSL